MLNPAERLRQARDASRIVDLRAVNDAVKFYGVYGGLSYGSSLVLLRLLPDTALTGNATSPVPIWDSPALSGGWSYQCVSGANLRKVDGLGWIPVNLSGLPPALHCPLFPLTRQYRQRRLLLHLRRRQLGVDRRDGIGKIRRFRLHRRH